MCEDQQRCTTHHHLKLKGILVIKSVELSGENISKSEKRKTWKKQGRKLWKNLIGSDGKPVSYLWSGMDVSNVQRFYHNDKIKKIPAAIFG